MNRVVALAWFQFKELFRSLAIVGPLALTLAFYWILFEYSGDVDYFAAAGGFTLIIACLAATLLLAGQANRASSYPLVARLRRRSELLAALTLCALGVTALMAVLLTLLVIFLAKIAVTPLEMLLIVPRWLALALVTATISLHLSRLVSRGGSYLIAFGLLAAAATLHERSALLAGTLWAGPARLISLIAWPVTTNLTAPAHPLSPLRYALGLLLALACAGLLFALAAALFRRKDLLWAE